MSWRFSDGTEVEPGGEIRGVSLFAQRLRHALLSGEASVTIWAQPASPIEVDPTDTGLLNAWLDHMLDRTVRIDGLGIKMTKRHGEISDLPDPPWKPEDLVEGRVY